MDTFWKCAILLKKNKKKTIIIYAITCLKVLIEYSMFIKTILTFYQSGLLLLGIEVSDRVLLGENFCSFFQFSFLSYKNS